jgi:hypothetical protein
LKLGVALVSPWGKVQHSFIFGPRNNWPLTSPIDLYFALDSGFKAPGEDMTLLQKGR